MLRRFVLAVLPFALVVVAVLALSRITSGDATPLAWIVCVLAVLAIVPSLVARSHVAGPR